MIFGEYKFPNHIGPILIGVKDFYSVLSYLGIDKSYVGDVRVLSIRKLTFWFGNLETVLEIC